MARAAGRSTPPGRAAALTSPPGGEGRLRRFFPLAYLLHRRSAAPPGGAAGESSLSPEKGEHS